MVDYTAVCSPPVLSLYRYAVIDSEARALYYFKDKKPQDLSLGFIPLWDARIVSEGGGSSSPRPTRGVRSLLSVSAPFRRTFYLGFESDETRDTFKRVMINVRASGRAQDSMWMNSWWRTHISKTGEDRVMWGRFSAALSRSLKVRLQLDLEATLCYTLQALRRTDSAEATLLEEVTLASLVEFSHLFGSLVDALESFDGVLQALTACSPAQAQKMLSGAQPGTFVLYLASRPTADSLAVLGLCFISARSKPQHKHIFRDPVSMRFYSDLGEPAFLRLDHMVACAIGIDETFARQTRLKLDEMERIKAMICAQQKDFLGSGAIEPNVKDGNSPPPERRVLKTSAAMLQRAKMEGSGPIFDEIDQLLSSPPQSLVRGPNSVMHDDKHLIMQPSVIDECGDDTSEMMLQNLYCVTCGAQLDGSGKFATCGDCGHFLLEQPSEGRASGKEVVWNEPAEDVRYSFIRNESLTASTLEEYQVREQTRRMTQLGLSQSLSSWSESFDARKLHDSGGGDK